MATEQTYQAKIIRFLESNDAYVIKTITVSKKGVPDIIACYRGYFVGIEVKTPSTMNTVSKLQQFNIDKINKCSGYAVVAWNIEVVRELLDEIDEEITTHSD